MIKNFIYGLAIIAGLTACNGDYTDWADPQSNAAKEETQKFTMTVTPVTTSYDFAADKATRSVQLFSTNLEDGQTSEYDVTFTGNGNTSELTVQTDGVVSISDIRTAIENTFGKTGNECDLTVKVKANVKVSTNEGYINAQKEGEPFTLKVVPPAIESSYSIVDADGTEIATLSNNGENPYSTTTFKAVVKTTGANQEWQIKGANGSVGPLTDGTNELSGDLAYNGGKGVIENEGKYNVSVDMWNRTYTIELAPSELYMTGDKYGWGSTWLQLNNVVDAWPGTGQNFENNFYRIIYLHANELFKFAPQAGWINDFGAQATINDKANAGVSADGTNIKVANAGWYLLHVFNDGTNRTVNILKPEVYLIGDAVGGWDTSENNKFSVPDTEDGEFVSPAFTASNNARMFVKIDGIDWWRSEFLPIGGTITYRTKDELSAVSVSEGQKVYLNFKDNTGEIK